MKQILFFIIISIGISSKGYSQIEFNKKFKAIPPINKSPKFKKVVPPETDIPPTYTPNVFKSPTIKTPGSVLKIKESTINMTPKNDFINPGDVYMDKMEKDLGKTLVKEGLKEDKSVLDRTDRYLGEYRTKSEFFVVKYRDHGLIDGDLINVYLNGKILRSELYLNSEFGEFRIPLALGFNDIELVVASTGTVGGNTADIYVLDDVNRPITTEYWDNKALGVKIKMIVIRE